MTLLAPAWLWLLVPWLWLFAYLLRSRGREHHVPFIDLWKRETPTTPPRRAHRLPPAFILMLLTTLLLAILAAAKPALDIGARQSTLNVLIDRGATMPEKSWQATIEQLRQAGYLPLVGFVPSASEANDELTMPSTALDTRSLLTRAIRARLASSDAALVVITNQRLQLSDTRLIQIAPDTSIRNVGIELLSVRSDLRPQLMVRVLNQSPGTQAVLRLRADAYETEEVLDLPVTGESRAYFIDLPSAPRVLRAEVRVDGDVLPHDDQHWLVKEGAWPRVEVSGPLPAELSRMIEVYRRLRPASRESQSVVVTMDSARLPEGVAGVVASVGAEFLVDLPPAIVAHPITEEIQWRQWVPSLRVTNQPPPAGFRPLVQVGDRTLVATRETSVRQVWLGIDATTAGDLPAFVILWTNILNWLGGEDATYEAKVPQTLPERWTRLEPSSLPTTVIPGWLPGLYEDRDGRRVAINAPAQKIEPPLPSDWRQAMKELPPGASASTSLSAALLVAAMFFALIAVLMMPKRQRPE